ncbi:hypothetical protein IU459_27940 [Nocardia amamiensis]|uniref:Uncharacterized protein n=1 Tax=Nocardia amamiensis TaxID=404578 RepID=A0ABS0CXL1_9NOCA|nr:hypothetical protein [Nocardia amamiensis]MBF6301343.1 hypothetical protein [Nocardia amamiensis]
MLVSVLGWLAISSAVLVAALLTAYYWPHKPDGPSVWDIRAELPHRAPPAPLTLDQAHRVAQDHRECLAEDCPRKRAALRTLITAGKLAPTPRLHELLFTRFGDEVA